MMMVRCVIDLQATRAEAAAEAAAWLARPIEVAECVDADCGGAGCGHPHLAHFYGDEGDNLGCVLCEADFLG